MTTAAPRVTVPRQRLAPTAEPERRGRTEITDRVVAKIACCAAREVPEVRDVRLGGMPWTRSTSAEVRGDRATVKLNVTVAYPAPLHAVAARLREHVRNRVAMQTGLTVTRLDVTMTDLDGGPE
ncbi:MAG: Asp23/Gls24 family envelope stress response protein [Nonomuraea sp.]|nr:Asp23/Gls24 family envelope stress response protein [Nonomuraea sp.]NUP67131.1 Asp23/Gls24 family envelope stress response protein [Nonomuraea sp.]NUP82711.1 Asp23/Gls24 family envelope stress response protein [Nonomuraea sp.]NUS08718.1 Asp23/Gls24 family envelope stress response protein [Nonomuraea sp.]NUT12822.1 Asp23/Gls24 family envelope stress response protein [Nonomuraea sp.]